MKRALLIIDVQNEYFTGKLPVTYPPNSVERIIDAIDFADSKGIPVVFIQHTAPQMDSSTFRRGTSEWELHDRIKDRPYSHLIEKNLPGSFTNTDLEDWLRTRDIEKVVIAGYMTQMCCDTTARQALHLGFEVEFLSDATGTLNIANGAGKVTDEELHRAILVTQAMRFSRVMTTEEWKNSI